MSFNTSSAFAGGVYSNWKTLGGCFMGDYSTHKTLYAGPDPSNSDRIIVRKLIQTSNNVFAFEETRITPAEEEGK